jgi:acylphosphatase
LPGDGIMADTRRTIHLRVEGRVQGVGYRAFVDMKAGELGLSGWVRNRGDGSVETVLQGSQAAIDAMLDLCRSGPPASRVDRVEIVGEGVGVFDRFEVRPTA